MNAELGRVDPDVVNSGPTVVLRLPEYAAGMMIEAIRRYVPASTGIDEELIGDLESQLTEWGSPDGEVPTLPGAVVRAVTPDGVRRVLTLLPDPDRPDSIPWCAYCGVWFAAEDLADVEVLFPGVPS